MARHHENYKELIWMLAKTDFKLRYHGSALGYVWAILKPLLMFTILNFVFSELFNSRGNGIPHYSLQLLVAIILFNFFSEGTSAGMNSLLTKSQLVTKIYVPRWTIIVAATINSAMRSRKAGWCAKKPAILCQSKPSCPSASKIASA